MPRDTLSCPPPRNDHADPEETFFELCFTCLLHPHSLGSPVPRLAWRQLCIGHTGPYVLYIDFQAWVTAEFTAQGMLSVQIKVTTNWLFSKSLPGCSR